MSTKLPGGFGQLGAVKLTQTGAFWQDILRVRTWRFG
jgi:hypothetical protein